MFDNIIIGTNNLVFSKIGVCSPTFITKGEQYNGNYTNGKRKRN